MNTAEILFLVVKLWLSAGAAVAAVFLTVGIDRIDEDAQGAYVFRPLLIPACLLIWPAVLWRWFVLETGRDNWSNRHKPPRDVHFWAAALLVFVVCLTLLVGLWQRPQWPVDFVPQQISLPQDQNQ